MQYNNNENEIDRIVERLEKRAKELYPDVAELYTASEFAKIAGRSRATIYRLPCRKTYMSIRDYVIRMYR